MAISSGMRHPASLNARIAPRAAESVTQKSPSGGSGHGHKLTSKGSPFVDGHILAFANVVIIRLYASLEQRFAIACESLYRGIGLKRPANMRNALAALFHQMLHVRQ